eukprot:5469525-Heterocapsa_arctica.AAC.1
MHEGEHRRTGRPCEDDEGGVVEVLEALQGSRQGQVLGIVGQAAQDGILHPVASSLADVGGPEGELNPTADVDALQPAALPADHVLDVGPAGLLLRQQALQRLAEHLAGREQIGLDLAGRRRGGARADQVVLAPHGVQEALVGGDAPHRRCHHDIVLVERRRAQDHRADAAILAVDLLRMVVGPRCINAASPEHRHERLAILLQREDADDGAAVGDLRHELADRRGHLLQGDLPHRLLHEAPPDLRGVED